MDALGSTGEAIMQTKLQSSLCVRDMICLGLLLIEWQSYIYLVFFKPIITTHS